jgi:hypothetical protein
MENCHMKLKTLTFGSGDEVMPVYGDTLMNLTSTLCEHIGADPDADPTIRSITIVLGDGDDTQVSVTYTDGNE